MNRNTGVWGNCTECHKYNRLDGNNRCQNCVEEDMKLIDIARKIFQRDPNITREQVSEKLSVTLERVDGWIRDRKIRCVSVKGKCPNCGRLLVNRFSCGSCGYSASAPATTQQTPHKKTQENDESSIRRVSHLQDRYWNRFSNIRKFQKRRLWLIPAKGELK